MTRKSSLLTICSSIVFLFLLKSSCACALDVCGAERVLEVKPWEVGQFATYQIISFVDEGAGEQNRYEISIIGKEQENNVVYFWLQIEIYEFLLLSDRADLVKNITFQMLVPPLTTEEFTCNPAKYIANGFFPSNAVKLKVQIYDSDFIEVDLKEYFSHQNLIENTAYSMTPEAMGKIDFSRMQFSERPEEISVPSGKFRCDHILVNTNAANSYHDEGFDLWHSKNVPLLGIVRMDFSKTLYWEKWSYRNEGKAMKSFKDFLRHIYTKRVPGRRFSDIHQIILVNYGQK